MLVSMRYLPYHTIDQSFAIAIQKTEIVAAIYRLAQLFVDHSQLVDDRKTFTTQVAARRVAIMADNARIWIFYLNHQLAVLSCKHLIFTVNTKGLLINWIVVPRTESNDEIGRCELLLIRCLASDKILDRIANGLWIINKILSCRLTCLYHNNI